ncbi:MAG: hypothetical protein ACLSVD_05465 [Eggerthellaceae bacterium]
MTKMGTAKWTGRMAKARVRRRNGSNGRWRGVCDGGSRTHPLPATEPTAHSTGAPSGLQRSQWRAGALRMGQKVGRGGCRSMFGRLIAVSAFFLAPAVAPEAAGNDALRTTVQLSGEAGDSQGAGAQEADGENASPKAEGDEAAAEDADSAGASAGVSDAGSSASGGGGPSSSGSAGSGALRRIPGLPRRTPPSP